MLKLLNMIEVQLAISTSVCRRRLLLQAPTVKNFVLRHGSMSGFFESYDADIICFQVGKFAQPCLLLPTMPTMLTAAEHKWWNFPETLLAIRRRSLWKRSWRKTWHVSRTTRWAHSREMKYGGLPDYSRLHLLAFNMPQPYDSLRGVRVAGFSGSICLLCPDIALLYWGNWKFVAPVKRK